MKGRILEEKFEQPNVPSPLRKGEVSGVTSLETQGFEIPWFWLGASCVGIAIIWRAYHKFR